MVHCVLLGPRAGDNKSTYTENLRKGHREKREKKKNHTEKQVTGLTALDKGRPRARILKVSFRYKSVTGSISRVAATTNYPHELAGWGEWATLLSAQLAVILGTPRE